LGSGPPALGSSFDARLRHAEAPRHREYDPARARFDIEYTFVSDGRVEVRRGSHRAYTCRELTGLLAASGFAVELAEAWTRDAHSVSLIATRIQR
jgi:hypothetical protein